MSRNRWLLALLFGSACGRVGFSRVVDDAGVDASDAGDAIVGPLALQDTGIDLGGLVALWAFDVSSASDGATFPAFPDASLVATLETGDARDVIARGKVGAAVDLDGVDDRLVVPDAPALDLGGPHTMTAWILMDQLPTNDYGVVGKERAYALEIEADTDCVDHSVYLPGGGFDELAPSGCALAAGTWHHVASVYDGVDLIVYQNGEVVGSMPYSGASVILNNNPVLLGHNTFQPGRYLDGRLDEVTIWSRALTAEELQTIERLQRPDSPEP